MMVNIYARFHGSSIEHRLVPGTKRTLCGRDAALANRYPALTEANSADRRIYHRCTDCSREK